MGRIIKAISIFFEKLNEDHVGEYAAKCAYFTFLSFIPFIILLLSLIKYMNIERNTLIYILEAVLPTVTKNSVLDIIQEVYSKSLETVSISAIFLLWSAANSFYSLSVGLSSIYKGEDKENHIRLRIKGLVGTIIVIFTIIMVLILIVFGNKINEIIQEKFSAFSEFVTFILSIREVLVIASLFLMFVLMYRFVPNKKGSRLKNQIPGALFSSIRMVSCFIFLFNLCRCIYKFFYYIWKFSNNNINYDVVICNNLYNFIRSRNKCNINGI